MIGNAFQAAEAFEAFEAFRAGPIASLAALVPIVPLAPFVLIEVVVGAIKVSAIVAIALAAARMAGQRSAAVRHWLLSLGLACATLMPLLQPIAPSWSVPAVAPWQLASETLRTIVFGYHVRVEDARPDWSTFPSISPVTSSPTDADSADVRGPRWLALEGDGRVAGLVNAFVAIVNGHAGPRATRVMTALAMVWAIGAIVCLSIVAVGFARLTWLATHARRLTRGRWIDMTRSIARELGLRRQIRVLHSTHPSLLVTWGLFRPMLLLPASAMTWSDERVHIVLHHELAHIRRHDWAMQICAGLLRCVYWFNPLLWLACARLRHESELACDDEVLRRGVEGTDYATHVLELARAHGRQRRRDAAPAAAMAHPSGLERRIRVMLNARLDRTPVSRFLRVASALVLAMMTLPIAGFGAARETAQISASLIGTVVDQSGAPVPDAEVQLMTASGERRGATVDANGGFTYTGLAAGAYVIEVRAMGFAPVEDHVTLSPDQRIERRVTLPIGVVEETLVVSGAGSSAARTLADPSDTAVQAAINENAARYRDQPLQPPAQLKVMLPEYPDRLRNAGVQGTVTLDTLINADGTITRVEASPHSEPALVAVAREAVLQWRYDPTRLHGVPVETRMKVTIEFRP